MKFTLEKLPFQLTSLEPIISSRTIEFHYGKHHQTYVNNLNNLISGTNYENMGLEEIIKTSSGGIFNNAAQVWNHTFYWDCLKAPSQYSEPSKELTEAIKISFGSFETFKEKFSNAAITLFGSGWAWLVKNKENKLEILQESNAGNPLTKGLTPLLTFDVWEHAYYLDYQNRRADYINNLWQIINWEKISANFKK
ncbi:MAG TPA: superoxide dismutase [Bacteroidales bacterium]|nr:superoxide dismutase [Bacteroidales bacterium]